MAFFSFHHCQHYYESGQSRDWTAPARGPKAKRESVRAAAPARELLASAQVPARFRLTRGGRPPRMNGGSASRDA